VVRAGRVRSRTAASLELYDQWHSQGVRRDQAGLDAALKDLSETQQIAELRRQIEMRTVGLGWREFEVKWGFYADERKHTIEKLTRMLMWTTSCRTSEGSAA